MNPSFPTVDVDCIPLYCHLGVFTTSSRAIVKAFPDLLSINVPLRFPSISTSVLFKTEKAIMIYWNKQIQLCWCRTVENIKLCRKQFSQYPTSNHKVQYSYQNYECRHINYHFKLNSVICQSRTHVNTHPLGKTKGAAGGLTFVTS